MRILAIGDIHGCYRALRTLADFAAFSSDDLVIALGDYVDKGPDSRGVLDWLIDYQRRARLIALRGNHDVMMLEARESRKSFRRWMDEGGERTLPSYSAEKQRDRGPLDDVPTDHWQFLEGTQRYYEIDTHYFVHANAYPDMPLEEQPDFMLFWEKFHNPPPHESGKIMVCGHTSQKSFEPVNLGHAICIDTRCFGGGWLTALDVMSGRLWQANESGKTQTGHIDEYRESL
jgi:serine/threonine protein phosphatase 1